MFGLVARVFCVSAGYLYPAYKCFKLLRGGPEAIGAASSAGEQRDVVKGILKYWIIMAGFTAGELVADTFIFWLPLVGMVKVGFVIWLVMPGIHGAEIVYDSFVEPYLVKHERTLDKYFQQARAVAQKSTHSVSKSAYDRWAGYIQRMVKQQSSIAGSSPVASSSTPPRSTAGDSAQEQPAGYPGLTGLLKNVSQKVPSANTAANYLAGLSGITEGPPTQADQVGKLSFSSLVTALAMSFSSTSYTEVPEDQRLRDIRTRKSQLQDMVSQLENSERAILAKHTPPVDESAVADSIRKPLTEEDGFERDAVIVGDSGAESSSEARAGASSSTAKDEPAANKGKVSSTASRRWFW